MPRILHRPLFVKNLAAFALPSLCEGGAARGRQRERGSDESGCAGFDALSPSAGFAGSSLAEGAKTKHGSGSKPPPCGVPQA
jgi:hypothetical protein